MDNTATFLELGGWKWAGMDSRRTCGGWVRTTYWRKYGRTFPQHYALWLERNGWHGQW